MDWSFALETPEEMKYSWEKLEQGAASFQRRPCSHLDRSHGAGKALSLGEGGKEVWAAELQGWA